MKKVLLFACLLLAVRGYAQQELEESRAAITIGILQGGGSLVGADFEYLAGSRVGLQVGAGLVGYGAAFNYHLKPNIRSSFLSFTYWHQGAGQSFVQSAAGPTFVFRGKKWLTAQLGLGYRLARGPMFDESGLSVDTPVMLLYSIGGYIPL